MTNCHISTSHVCLQTLEQAIHLSSHCLEEKLPYMLKLWEELFCRYDLLNMLTFVCIYLCLVVNTDMYNLLNVVDKVHIHTCARMVEYGP